ncbi:UTP--glucose-1-phosphate uridylyltransferase [Varibaculum prostatecancerukia]|uniref:UTP--glucose-1-phosphate uridylyltransferase n=1 Tax=Varibaculum prostatecancerukia TaxID=2811781 RepID=UPI001C003506|nr:UTP--glucose-1-phosphate uridylyltransferase [Varibaculum prostatecancerukia]
MSETGLAQAIKKMENAGVSAAAISVFSHYYQVLEGEHSSFIPEETISPLTSVDRLEDNQVSPQQAQSALAKTVMIKLNGGLGTSMGMDKAKSLLPVRAGLTFLDIICQQVMAARKEFGVSLPLIFMDSFRTQADTLAALQNHPGIEVSGLPLDFLQNQEPKLRADDLTPVSWEKDPSLEWCPPGHGDIYTALYGSGLLDKLIDAGYRYAMTSNSDNLGATPNAEIAGWFAASGAPYAAELCIRTINDRKGGHLAIRKADGQLILRDTAQTPPEQMDYFTDEHRHPFFHTNNLWFDLVKLRDTLVERNAVLGLPLIANHKTVDPSDSQSPAVIQMETAMGAAIASFKGATAILVPRSRFLPVKTTNELTLVRSDIYELGDNYHLLKVNDQEVEVDLDSRYFKKIADFEARFPAGVPSLREAKAFKVSGPYTFGKDVKVQGQVSLETAEEQQIAAGTSLAG